MPETEMNTYIFTVNDSAPHERGVAERCIDATIPGQLSALYTHFILQEGMLEAPVPVTISWWADGPIVDVAQVLLPWQAKDRATANWLLYLTQLNAGFATPNERIELTRGMRLPKTQPYVAQIETVSRFLGAALRNGAQVVHAYSCASDQGAGSMIGLRFNDQFLAWIRKSIARHNKE